MATVNTPIVITMALISLTIVLHCYSNGPNFIDNYITLLLQWP
jgi:hypothetical protein